MKHLHVLLLVLTLASCAPTRTVPVETVRTEYRDRLTDRLTADTVRTERLVLVKGDTVVDIRRDQRVRRLEIHDTCYIELLDSVRVPYPVERALGRWERVKMDFGGIALGALGAAVCAAVIWLIRKFRK